MAAEHWFRWHHGTVTDPKWKTVATRAAKALSRNVTVGHVVSVWAAMMENASQAVPRGQLSNWSDEDIGNALDLPEEEVAAIRLGMQGKTLDSDALIRWNARQPKAEDPKAAARKQAQRERDKSHDATADSIASRDVTAGHDRDRGETEKNSRARDSLRSSSSTAAPPTGAGDESDDQCKARKAVEAAQRLSVHTDNAMAAYNAIVAKPAGLLSRVTKVGIEERRTDVKRCLRVAARICQHQYGDPAITPQFWDDYFHLVAEDDFKSGRQKSGKGHPNWRPGFEYLTRRETMTEVFEHALEGDGDGEAGEEAE